MRKKEKKKVGGGGGGGGGGRNKIIKKKKEEKGKQREVQSFVHGIGPLDSSLLLIFPFPNTFCSVMDKRPYPLMEGWETPLGLQADRRQCMYMCRLIKENTTKETHESFV